MVTGQVSHSHCITDCQSIRFFQISVKKNKCLAGLLKIGNHLPLNSTTIQYFEAPLCFQYFSFHLFWVAALKTFSLDLNELFPYRDKCGTNLKPKGNTMQSNEKKNCYIVQNFHLQFHLKNTMDRCMGKLCLGKHNLKYPLSAINHEMCIQGGKGLSSPLS